MNLFALSAVSMAWAAPPVLDAGMLSSPVGWHASCPGIFSYFAGVSTLPFDMHSHPANLVSHTHYLPIFCISLFLWLWPDLANEHLLGLRLFVRSEGCN